MLQAQSVCSRLIRYLTLTIIFLLCATGATLAQSGSTLNPAADAYVQDGSVASTNFGSATTLLVKAQASAGNRRIAYLRFDLSSVQGSILGAKLKLYGNNSTAGYSGTETAYAVASNSWSESGITWNTAPTLGAAIGSAQVTSTKQYVTWDLGSYVSDAQTNGASAVSIALVMNTPTDKADTFVSREGSSNLPQLVLSIARPAAPGGLTATAGTNLVTLAWSSANGATSYDLFRSTTSGGPYALVTNSTATVYQDVNVINNTTYYYVVSAVNSGGDSVYSPEASATPLPPVPPAPSKVQANPGDTKVTITWNSTPNAASYRVYRSLSPHAEGTTPFADNITATTFQDTGLTNAVTYYYQISAKNTAGEGPRSNEVSAVPRPAPPAVPTNLIAVPSNQQVSLFWQPSATATGYNVKRAFSSEGPYTTIASIAQTKFTDAGLTNGVSYYYTVSATNAGGESDDAPDISATPGLTSFVIPIADSYVRSGTYAGTNYGTDSTILTKKSTGSANRITYVRFSLSGVPSSSGSIMLRLYGRNNGSGYNATDTVYAVSDTNWTETGITYNNKPATGATLGSAPITSVSQYYSFNVTGYVKSLLAAGQTTASFAVLMDNTPANVQANIYQSREGAHPPQLSFTLSPPNPPAGLTATATPGLSQVVLQWTGVTGATSYNVKRSQTAGGPYTAIASSTTPSYTDNNLSNGNTYYYVVSSVSSGGESGNSNEATATVPKVYPGVGVADSYVQQGSASSNFGTATTVQVKNGNGSTTRYGFLRFDISNISGPVGSAILRLNGKNGGSGYTGTDTVYAVSNNTWTETGITFANMPAIGSALATASITSTSQWYSWNVSAYVQQQIAAGATQVSFAVKMDAVPANGQGDNYSSREGANAPQLLLGVTPPVAPANLAATAPPGQGQVVLTWDSVPTATSYIVKRATVHGGPYTTLTTVSSPGYTDSSGTSGVQYFYIVTASNAGGESPGSNEASGTPSVIVLSSFTITPNDLYGGGVASATIRLNGPAPASGVTVTLESDQACATVPPSVVISSGQTTADVPVNTTAVTQYTTATLTATYGTSTLYSSITVDPPPPPVSVNINFQPTTSTVPSGYIMDAGAPYSDSQGFGWVREDSLNGTHVPLDLTANVRDRKRAGIDPRLNTIIHMQYPPAYNTPGVTTTPGTWEYALPNGTYHVTVSVGDTFSTQTNSYDSLNTINVEGVNAINRWQGTSAKEYLQTTVTATVTDGKLTIDAIGGSNTKLNYVQITNVGISQLSTPTVTGSNPADGDTGVDRSTAVSLDVSLPNLGAGVDPATLTSGNISLIRVSDGASIATTNTTDAAGSVILVQPQTLLISNTLYRFALSSRVKDTAGAPFAPYTIQFTTGESTRIPVDPDAQFGNTTVYSGDGASALTMGPDHKLYAGFLNGNIARWTIDPSGTLSNQETFTGFAGRALTGMVFDQNNPNTLWITNNDPVFPQPAADFSGRISQLQISSGAFTGTIQDYIVGLPRSAKDHMTNSLAFGPDGFLYATQASNTSMGAPDSAWFNRPERLLNAAVLRIDPSITTGLPINVQTETYNGTPGAYNPYAPGAPVTLYAMGLRNAFDLIWHSNGTLYCPTNGASAGGSTPASPTGVTPAVPAIVNGPVQDDYLFKVMPGKYYGHPNTIRGQFVLNGGNPTGNADPAEVVSDGVHQGYPIGVVPDSNYAGFNMDLGLHISADGALEYQSNTFGGALQHRLLITEYSAGKDLVAVKLDANGNAVSETQVAAGFQAPLDVVEDPTTGNIYLADLIDGGVSGQIDLLRPNVATLTVSPLSLAFNGVVGSGPTASLPVILQNTGQAPLTIPSHGLNLGGASFAQFSITDAPTLPLTLAAGESVQVMVAYTPTVQGPVFATLKISSNDPHTPLVTVNLSGLGAAGLGGSSEPSLQWILTSLGYNINVGDPDPTNSTIPTSTGPLGDEVIIQRFAKAGPGQVSITPLAAFGPQDPSGNCVLAGWYHAGDANSLQALFAVPNTSYQAVNPPVNGNLSFDPGTTAFGMYASWPFFAGRTVYQEDALNTFAENLPPHHVRIFPAKRADGTVEKNAYIMTFEDSANSADFNDLVYIIRNVRRASGHVAVQNLDVLPNDNRLVFNRIGSLANPPAVAVHDTVTIRLKNTGIDPLNITGLNIPSPWVLGTSLTLPLTLGPASTYDVPIKFVAESGRISTGTMNVLTDDISNPSVNVQLAGYWQSIPEGNPSQEPTFEEIVSLFGYSTTILYPGQALDNFGHVEAVGEEVLSPYWRQADSSQPVFIRQLNAYHTVGNTTTVRWYPKSDPTALGRLFIQDPGDGQTLLPRVQGLTGPAQQSFNPGVAFGWKLDSEWSDPAFNNPAEDPHGAPPIGHHVRIWPARDSAGLYIPHTWIMTMDYGGGNYDYNDNAFLFSNCEPENPDRANFVNPFIGADSQSGTDSLGATFPGSQTPFGMVQLSPDTTFPAGGGYNYGSNEIVGFSHTHLSGPGGPAYGDISFMPTVGQISSTDPATYGSTFVHSGEVASPGYYKVALPTYGVQAELTSTARTGWHRYTFPATASANVLINTAGSLRGDATSTVNIVDNQTVEGSATSWAYWNTVTGVNPNPYTVYFTAKFDHPFTTGGTWDASGLHPVGTSASGSPAGAYVTFDATTNHIVLAKVGISFTSLSEARSNLAAETTDFDFDNTSKQARIAWNSMLNRVEVAGGTPAQQIAFYTALYHTFQHPNLFSDVDGSYIGFDNVVHQNVTQPDYANFSLWDTYRTEHPLLSLLAPATNKDMMGSLMRINREGGWLPRWSFGNAETNELTGDPALPVLVDAYFKGQLSDPASDVYAAAIHNATQLPPSTSQFQGRLGLNSYVTNGYVPYDPSAGGANAKLKYGTSTTLEYGVADGALSLMANALNIQADGATFAGRSHSYRNLFDSSTGYLRPKMTDGSFLSTFDPAANNVGFKEGSSAQYTWLEPQDPLGLANLMGGKAAAAAKLDQLFGFPQLSTDPQSVVSTLWGSGAYYNPTNEPGLHTPFFYNYYGQPWKAQTVVHAQQSLYTTGANGLPGNDDLGTLSAWYALTAMGIYPAMPGAPFYTLTTPLFPSIVVHLDPNYYSGQTLKINAPGLTGSSYFIQSATLNGAALTNNWLPQSAIQTAGTLTFSVGSSPSTWGTAAAAAPPNVCP